METFFYKQKDLRKMKKLENGSFEDYKKKYQKYLNGFDDIANNSKKSYVSNAKHAIDCFENYFNRSYKKEFVFYKKIKGELNSTCMLVKDYLYKVKSGQIKDNDISTKKASDDLVAFALFQGMLSEYNLGNNNAKRSTLKQYLRSAGIKFYSKNEIISTFKLRLMTQRRDYKHIKFYPQLLKRIVPEIENKLLQSLNEMVFYSLKVRYKSNRLKDTAVELKKFKEMNSIVIEKDFVYANFENEQDSYILLTPNADYTRFYPFKPNKFKKELDEITLDHKECQHDITEKQYEEYPELQEFTLHIKGKGSTAKLDSTYLNALNHSDFLEKEIDMIISQTTLVAMSRSENSRKGGNSTNN